MKKGQVAIEFLTTYGWAIAIVLLGIGALAYFGILDVSTFLPDKCLMTKDVECRSFQLTENSGIPIVEFVLRNQHNFELVDLTMSSSLSGQPSSSVQCTWFDGTYYRPPPKTILPAETSQWRCTGFCLGNSICHTPFSGASKIKMTLNGTYIPEDGAFYRPIQGWIRGQFPPDINYISTVPGPFQFEAESLVHSGSYTTSPSCTCPSSATTCARLGSGTDGSLTLNSFPGPPGNYLMQIRWCDEANDNWGPDMYNLSINGEIYLTWQSINPGPAAWQVTQLPIQLVPGDEILIQARTEMPTTDARIDYINFIYN